MPQNTSFRMAATVTQLGYIEVEPVRWLWPGCIPMGALTLIAGDPGVGKSMLALDIVARVTTGRTVMAALSYMAEMYKLAFLAVTHLNKQASIRAMYRSAGHMALVAATRCAHLVARETSGDGSKDDGRRMMLPVKNNLYSQRPA